MDGEIVLIVQHSGGKVESAFSLDSTIAHVKERMVEVLKTDKSAIERMKILCKGKIREDEETLFQCGLKAPKAKVKLVMKADPNQAVRTQPVAEATKATAKQNQGMEKKEKTEVVLSLGTESVIVLKVVGHKEHDITIKVDSMDRKLGEIRKLLSSNFAWPYEQFSLLVRGKNDDKLTLAECKLKPPKAKIHMRFDETFYLEAAGNDVLQKSAGALDIIELEVDDIQKRLQLRLLTQEDAAIEVLYCRDRLINVTGPLKESQVKKGQEKLLDKMRSRAESLEKRLKSLVS